MSKQGLKDGFNHSLAAAAAVAPVAVLNAPDVPGKPAKAKPRPSATKRNSRSTPVPSGLHRFAAIHTDDDGGNRQAELFYLQKQIQLQTQMIFILEDGSRIEGVVEWYDRHSIKVRGKSRLLIYKSAIKYLYKAGELGSLPEK